MNSAVDIVDEVLSTARSVRRNLDFDRPVERTVLLECIDVAAQAPTGAMGENWRFVVVDDAAKKADIASLYGDVLHEIVTQRGIPMKPTLAAHAARMHEIPALVFVCMAGEPDADFSSHVGYYGSILPAAWSLMLALRAREIGTTWTTLLSARQNEVGRILGLPDEWRQIVMLPVGYTKGAVLKRAQRLPAQQITYWNGWEQKGE